MRLEESLSKALLENPDFAREYYKYDLEFEIAMQVFEGRLKAGMTQKELAKKINTKQPSIARLENGSQLPNLGFLKRIAEAFGTHLIAPKFAFLEEKPVIETASSYSTVSINALNHSENKLNLTSYANTTWDKKLNISGQ